MGKADLEQLQARIEAGEKRERKEKLKQMKKEMKKKRVGFFQDFKKFITRGNVLDMAVGVIVGGAFTAIINALSNNILKPVINWLLALILGKDTLSEVFTFLKTAYVLDENGAVTKEIDLANSIYIDWGAFINAIINFLLIAFTLFVIVRIINNVRKRLDAKELAEAAEKAKAEEEKKKAEEAAKAEAAAAAAKAEADRLAAFFANVERQTKLLEELAKK
ncbi:MAG: large conductance mechanosensitive channel protein MscL [Clostridia bacterium]|nr:large conductance mechanosensitive channel protein MscL [Clostridia bacterium]